MTQQTFNNKNYDEIWSYKFNFYQTHGAPISPEYKEALKSLPVIEKMRMNMNAYAFIFGFIYFFVKGMNKSGIIFLFLFLVRVVLAFILPQALANGIGFVFFFLAAFTANYTFYRKEILGEEDFNIFKGIFTK